MIGIKKDLYFLKEFFFSKKVRILQVIAIFLFLVYVSVGLLTFTTTKTFFHFLDIPGWFDYVTKIPLHLEYRMSPLGIFFFLATLFVVTLYVLVVISSFRQKRSHAKTGSLVGILTILGIGCASCGTIVLTSMLGVIGAAGLITFFPLHGGEFQILAFIVATLSLHVLIQKTIQKTCDLEPLT